MKKVLFAIAAVALVGGTMTTTSCKKGENDPFLSLRSRTSRLANNWTMQSGTLTQTQTVGSASATTTTTFTETEQTIDDGTNTVVYTIGEWSLNIDKDGTYVLTQTTTLSTVDGTAVPGQEATTTTDSGQWAWMGKNSNGDWKNKEAFIMNTTQTTETGGGHNHTENYTGWQSGSITVIDQLKNKEMIATVSYSETDDEGDSFSVEGTYTLKGE